LKHRLHKQGVGGRYATEAGRDWWIVELWVASVVREDGVEKRKMGGFWRGFRNGGGETAMSTYTSRWMRNLFLGSPYQQRRADPKVAAAAETAQPQSDAPKHHSQL
jgi:hypothetical protein